MEAPVVRGRQTSPHFVSTFVDYCVLLMRSNTKKYIVLDCFAKLHPIFVVLLLLIAGVLSGASFGGVSYYLYLHVGSYTQKCTKCRLFFYFYSDLEVPC